MTLSEAEKKFIEAAKGDYLVGDWCYNDNYYDRDDNNYGLNMRIWMRMRNNVGNMENYYDGLNNEDMVDYVDGDRYWDDDGETCNQCKKKTTSSYWCRPCSFSNFQEEFDNWESENKSINAFIKDAQKNATSSYKILEWIPYSKFKNTEYLAEGGFGKVYSAEWSEGNIIYWSAKNSQWKRKGTTKVALKCLNDSQNITGEFLNEIQNLYNCNGTTSFITRCYGITRHDETNNFMIVMQLMNDGSLRNNLSDLRKMPWNEKFICLSRIAEGLSQMHSVELIHQDFHTGNILLSSIGSNTPYITDLGLCKPVKKSAENRKVYGVIPYVAPEVLRGDEYTKAADVYAFGVIMSEVISGTPPFSKFSHDKTLAQRIYGEEKLRPKVSRNTPALVVELMQKCWDDDAQNRLSSRELRNILRAWRGYKESSELGKQIEESEKMTPDPIDNDKIHPEAIYTSRCLTDELEL